MLCAQLLALGYAEMSQAEQHLRIDYIEFAAVDLPQLKQFYQQVFAWAFTDYGPHYSSFTDGRMTGGFTTEATVSDGALVVIYARDLESVCDQVAAAGGQITQAIFSFPGGRRFEFRDPSGNRLAVWSQ
jgi:predicted enzyme related to lactoylglutathione lyase